jgi:hypothetical protein
LESDVLTSILAASVIAGLVVGTMLVPPTMD